MFIEILFKMLLFKGGVLIYAEHCIYIYIYIYNSEPHVDLHNVRTSKSVMLCPALSNIFSSVLHDSSLARDRRYPLFYFRYDTDIFKPGIVDTYNYTDTSKLN